MDEKQLANLVRWDGQKQGFYEVYFLKFNVPKTRDAFWLRYTITSPSACCGNPRAELWGIYFDGSDKNHFAIKNTFPVERLRWDNNRFRIDIADSWLDHESCKGEIDDPGRGHRISWNLSFHSTSQVLYHYPYKRLYLTPLPKTKVLSPHVDAVFSGTITVDGKVFKLSKVPGEQEHIWGTQHAKRWSWGHCFGFDQDPGAAWEGLDAQVGIGPFTSPGLKVFFLHFDGQWHKFNKPKMWLLNKSSYSLGRWTFGAKNNELHIKGEISCDLGSMVGVTYLDPDGSLLWCSNTKLASIQIRINNAEGRHLGNLTAEKKCALELVDRRVQPGVPIWV